MSLNILQTPRRHVRRRKPDLELPPKVNNLSDLINMAQTGKKYANIDNQMLWRISAQLIEINDMVGMKKLKESIFYHVIYYLQDLYMGDENDYLHTAIIGPPGCGKCLGYNTPILMYNGSIKYVQDIEVGDMLMGDDSTPRTVQSTCTGQEQMYEILSEISDDSYCVNKSHILSLVKKSDNSIHDIELKEYLKNPDEYMGYKTSIHFNDTIQMTVDPYILGYSISNYFIFADIIAICITDDKISEYFISCNIITELTENIYKLRIEDYIDWFRDGIPDTYKKFNRSDLLGILSGLQDALGIRNKHDTVVCNFDSSKNKLNKLMKDICNILGIPYEYNIRKVEYVVNNKIFSDEYYTITIPNASKYIPSLIYESDMVFKDEIRIVPYPIRVIKLEEDNYYGFELDGNGRFVLGNYTVTHNTTVAKIIGEMYKNMGILSPDGIFKIAKREDLVAEYLGQTATKTKKLLESCIGGVLFIDEVYALGPGKKDHDSFAKEAIDTLNVFLSENSNSFCCIIAGYEEDIKKCFFSVNKGLERRFQWIHRIEEYSIDELGDMFIKILYDIRWKKSEELTKEVIVDVLSKNKDKFKSFGGDIENLITKCKMAHAKRIINSPNPKRHIIIPDDLELAIDLMTPNSLNKNRDEHVNFSMYI